MLTNYHIHTNFCDGKDLAEEIVLTALEKGFDAIGFSGHGFTEEDLSFCMKKTEEYIEEVKRLKEKYAKQIQIYLGVEEDCRQYVNRKDFDYIIGSSHYVKVDGEYYSVDHNQEGLLNNLKIFNGDSIAYAKSYYERVVSYILKRKPDIVGHFDLITKFDDIEKIFLEDEKYNKLAESYLLQALKSQSIFEVNTGAMARGLRNYPYPAENLLYLINKNDGKVMINSDCHFKEKIDFQIKESKIMLKEIGYKYVYVLYDNEFKKEYI